jgi:hypothetical protein
VKCASNLRQIGQAMAMYSNNETRSGQAFPRTQFVDGAALIQTDAGSTTPSPGYNQFLSFGDTGAPSPVGNNNVMASIFLILKTQDLTPAVFVCPTTQTMPDDFPHPADPTKPGPIGYSCWDAPANKYLSYSMQVPFPSKAAILDGFRWNAAIAPDFAVAADINPGVPALLTITATSTRIQMQAANSPNHEGEGQNVMYGDFHVEWNNNPLAGATRGTGAASYQDNIYTYGVSPGPTGIVGPPQDHLDSILLPVVGQGFVVPQKTLFQKNPMFMILIVLGIAVLVIGGVIVAIVLALRPRRVPPPPLPGAPPR